MRGLSWFCWLPSPLYWWLRSRARVWRQERWPTSPGSSAHSTGNRFPRPASRSRSGRSQTVHVGAVIGTNFNGNGLQGASIPYAQGYGAFGYRWRNGSSAVLSATYFGNNNSYDQPAFKVFDFNGKLALTKRVVLHAQFANSSGIYCESLATLGDDANYLNISTITGSPISETALRQHECPRAITVRMDDKL